ncbi:hypothetical protein FF011L_52190 [Roseimaritima multifibrata]|uniref:Carboxypeptidase regulatory-like domain-containing protein n=1 Tax=Roseimaritima multifibrata TaxID=1930274 RepID=A0A517MNF3_9BACT|nr:hypothetical protein FF011L_52190 [Roseimaritima multifibrata]
MRLFNRRTRQRYSATPLLLTAAIGLAALTQIGCGGPSRPTTYPVTGTITQDGKPVADATVSFVSLDSNQSSVGKTDASGNYQLTTFEANDGALPGQYKVRVFKFEPTEELANVETASDVGEDVMEEMPSNYADPAASSKSADPKNLLPAIYNSATRTPLETTVTEGENKADFTIEGK